MTRFTLVLSLIACCTAALDVRAQGTSRLEPGTRVRLLLADDTAVRGRLALGSPDTIVLSDGRGAHRAYAKADVRALEVHAGRRSRKARGAAAGGVIGTAIGAAIGAVSSDTCGFDQYRGCATGESAIAGAVLFGVLGAALGGAAGAIRYDEWQVVAPPWETPVAAAPDTAARPGRPGTRSAAERSDDVPHATTVGRDGPAITRR